MTGRTPNPKTIRQMSLQEIAWVAGLLEGEGSFLVKNDRAKRPEIACNMTDKDVLERLHKIVGAGRLTGPYVYKRPNCKPAWHWRLATRNDIPYLCKAVYPFMGERRRHQIDIVLNRMKELGYE